MLNFQGAGEPVTQEGFLSVLDLLGLKAPELLAVVSVETSGCGFLPDRRPAILFERHIFSRTTGGKFDASHPDISNPKPGGYKFGADEYPRLAAAIQLDRDAALQSASWGAGQIMGFNFKAAGYPDVESMVQDACAGEDGQLKAMANFLKSSGLHRALAAHDWTSFARGYNGADFQKNNYDARLAGAFQMYQQGPLPDIIVRRAQLWLTYAGFKLGRIDGVIGKMTRAAVQAFQESRGLADSDEINDDLITALRAAVIPAAGAAAT